MTINHRQIMKIHYLLFALSLFLFFSCQNATTPTPDIPTPDEPEEGPGEWMYNQRAYPHNHIDFEAYRDAVQQTIRAKEEARANDRDDMEWQVAGPLNIGGRVTDVALHPTDQNIIYIGASVGGVFKSMDAGATWAPIFDEEGVLTIGNLTVSEANPNVIYVGTGEANGSATSGAFFGTGIYKSTDAGATWNHVGLENSQHIGRIVVRPGSSDTVYVAAAGLLYGKSEDKGVYRSYDGGDTWEKVLFVSDSTSVIDVAIDYQSPDIIYAASWERIRRPWGRSYGGVTSGIWRSMDGGDTWEPLTNGLPVNNPQTGRIGLATTPSQSGLIYATFTTNPVTNIFNGVYRSQDFGDTWERVDNNTGINNVFGSFGWFFGNVRINPHNIDEIFVLGVPLMKSSNGGLNWNQIASNNHVDNHGLEIHPQNPDFMVAGNDGGVYISQNGGQTWNHVETLPITQFYEGAIDNLEPSRIYGGSQDNGTMRTLTGALDDWEGILGGDGFHVIVDPTDNNFVYAEYQWGNLFRSINGGFSFMVSFAGEFDDRTNWNTPVVLDPSNPHIIYYGANRLYRSDDRGSNWLAISGDLTDGPHPSGSNSFGTISSIAVAATNGDYVYVGTDDGNVQVTTDGGDNWTNISNGVPDRSITEVAVDPYDENTIFVTVSGYRWTDYIPHVLRSTNTGQTWEDISGNLPEIPVNDIIIDPDQEGTYYIANDLGVWVTSDAGLNWSILDESLPTTVINDLVFHQGTRTLVAATFGRSMQKIELGEVTTSTKPAQPAQTAQLELYPNPIRQSANIRFKTKEALNGSLEVFSLSGQKMRNLGPIELLQGEQVINQDFSGLQSGQYILRFASKELILTSKFQVID